MSDKSLSDNQTTVALSGNATVPVAGKFPLPGEHSNLLPVGTRLGEFELTGLVGEGGFGIVYLAYDHSLHRQVAVKEYIPSSLANRGPDGSVAILSDQHIDAFRAGLNSFINEARLLAQFDHPSLLKVYRFWEGNGTAYMAMPYYEGITLRKAVRNLGGPPDEEWLKHVLRPLIDALSVMHDAQCFHRDIAPDNILILTSGRPVLLDFGAARRVIADMTQAPTVILKPGYAPVEQYGEEAAMRQGAWTDVYALAAVVYSAIVGKAPQASISRYMSDSLKPVSTLAAGRYSEQFLAAIDKGLAVKPADRPQSVEEFRALLGLGDRRQRARPVAPTVAPDLKPAEPMAPPQPAQDDATVVPMPPIAAPPVAAIETPRLAPAAQAAADEPSVSAAVSIDSASSARPAADARNAEVMVAPRAAGPTRVYLLAGLVLIAVLGAAAWFWLGRSDRVEIARRAPSTEPTSKPIGSASEANKPIDAPKATDAPRPSTAAPPDATTPATAAAPPALPAAEAAPVPPKVEPPPVPLARPIRSPGELFSQVLAGASASHAVKAVAEVAQVAPASGTPRFTVSSSTSGYLYVLKLGPAADEIQLVFPNLADQKNRIAPDKPLALPGAGWAKASAGQTGIERYIAMVSDEPRDFSLIDSRARGPFKTFRNDSLARLQRDYDGGEPLLAGLAVCPAGITCSPSYGAAEFSIERTTLATVAPLPVPTPTEAKPEPVPATVSKPPAPPVQPKAPPAKVVEKETRPLHTQSEETKTPKNTTSPNYCNAIIERASLGESLTPDQMAYLKKECGR